MLTAKKIAKNILIQVLYYSGLPVIFREFIQKNRVTILVLHKPPVEIADIHFNWLRLHYNIISLNQYLVSRTNLIAPRLPPKPLVITLDDGHIENYGLLPLVKQYKIPVTIFLCSGIVNTNRHYWFRFSGLPSSSESLKAIPDSDRLGVLYQAGFFPEKEFASPQALTKSQIIEMKEYINFQGHTVFHPCLPQCSDQKSLVEIDLSKKQLDQEFNLSVNALAYPNGDYTEREIHYARKAGYSCAVTTQHGFNDDKTDLFRLRRLGVGDRDSSRLLAVKASGLWAFLKHFYNNLKAVKNINKRNFFLLMKAAPVVECDIMLLF